MTHSLCVRSTFQETPLYSQLDIIYLTGVYSHM